EARGEGATTAGLLDKLEDARFPGLALGHRVGGAVKDDHSRARVGERLGGPDDVVGELPQRSRPLAGHAQARGVHADPRGGIALELHLGGGVAGRDNETDARRRRRHRKAPWVTVRHGGPGYRGGYRAGEGAVKAATRGPRRAP